jgi:hypothetical protein
MYDRGITDAKTEPRLPETCLPEASLLLMLALNKSVCQLMITRHIDSFEYYQSRLRTLGWHFEKDSTGKWISLAEDGDPPVPGFENYRTYVEHRVLYADGRFVRNTLSENLLAKLWDYVKFANDTQGSAPRTVQPCLRRGESTAWPFTEEDEDGDGAASPVAALG